VRTLSPWRGVLPTTMDEGMRLAKAIAASGFAPASYYPKDPDPESRLRAATAAVFAAIQLGAEVGLSPMSAVQNIALINGRPGLFGPAMLAVVRNSGLLAAIDEGVRTGGDGMEGYCTVTRAGEKARTYTFTMAQAKRAGLTSKVGPWTQYPDRMLLARARTFALKDVFPDVLLGLSQSVEELQDISQAPLLDLPRPPAPELEPRVQQIEVIMPGDMDPEYFPQTKRGLDDLVRFLADTVLDGGSGVVLLNQELLDRLAKAGYAEAIAEIREVATKALRGEPDDIEAHAAEDADDEAGED
jgi:hypothetical protein